jgi:hypothetical protein
VIKVGEREDPALAQWTGPLPAPGLSFPTETGIHNSTSEVTCVTPYRWNVLQLLHNNTRGGREQNSMHRHQGR